MQCNTKKYHMLLPNKPLDCYYAIQTVPCQQHSAVSHISSLLPLEDHRPPKVITDGKPHGGGFRAFARLPWPFRPFAPLTFCPFPLLPLFPLCRFARSALDATPVPGPRPASLPVPSARPQRPRSRRPRAWPRGGGLPSGRRMGG